MKVSIITVTYNSAKTLSRTIESVLHQTYKDIDYWIIDGKSTDDTIDIVTSYEQQFHNRLHWISESDNGIYDAMNKGIGLCSGDVVGFLNSDDWFSSDIVIEKMTHAFTNDVDAVYGDIHFVSNKHPYKKIYFASGRPFHPFLLQFGVAPPHPSFYVRKSIIEKYGSFNSSMKIAADFDLMARLLHKYKIRTKYLHLDFVAMSNGGASTKDRAAYIYGLREILQSCNNLGIRTNKRKLALKRFFAIVANRI